MKRIPVELSHDIVSRIDRLTAANLSRSEFIEAILLKHLQELDQNRIEQHDLEKINAAAERLNPEALDVLTYQSPNR